MAFADIAKQRGGVAKYISQTVHNQVLQKYVFSKDVFKKQAQAARLEYYFNLIASYVRNLKTGQQVPGTNEFINELIMNGLPVDRIFQYDQVGFSKAGFQFEKDFP